MQHILIVDDEDDIRNVVALYLKRDGFSVETAGNGEEALNLFARKPPNLIVLDLVMPKLGGLEVLRSLRAESNVPIILLTSRDEEVDRVLGLEMGADDYVTKPFSPRELVARVKAVLRRGKPATASSQPGAFQRGAMQIDPNTRLVTINDKTLALTLKEFDLLWLLANNPGKVFSRDELLEKVWGYEFEGDNRTVTVHMRRLRKKIESDPANPDYVLTVWGIGYKFSSDL